MLETFFHWGFTVLAGGALSVLFFPIRLAYRKAKAAGELVVEINRKMDLAINNHLHTIQENTSITNVKLGETNKLLYDQNGDMRELLGYLKGKK